MFRRHAVSISLLVFLMFFNDGSLLGQDNQALHDTGLVCAVDMGSNTFKFIVAEIENGEYAQHITDKKTAAVGDDVNASEKKSGHKIISDGKIKEIQSLLAGFQDECERKTGSRKIHAIATAAFREAENGNDVSERLKLQGVEMRILSEEGESAYAYEVAALNEPGFAVLDMGSRTTEFVTKSGPKYQWTLIPTGYKIAWDAFYDKAGIFSQASTGHLKRLKELIGEKEKKILAGRKELRVVEAGETSSYVLAIPQNQIEGKIITQLQVKNKLKELFGMDSNSFAELKRNFKDAAKVLPRLVLIDFILAETGYDQFRGTDRELNVAIVYRLARSEGQ